MDGFTLAIRGQSPCGESPADRGHRSQSFSLVTTDPVGVHACSEVLHGDAAKTSSGVQSPEDTRTRWRFLGRDDLVLICGLAFREHTTSLPSNRSWTTTCAPT